MISTSGMRISCLIHQDSLSEAVKAVHQEFQLEKEGETDENL